MSKGNIKLFFNKVNEDATLQEQLTNVTIKHHEELVKKIIEIGAENGYTFAKEDMNQLMKERIMENGELSEVEMEAIAGGGMDLTNPFFDSRYRLIVTDPIEPEPISFDDKKLINER